MFDGRRCAKLLELFAGVVARRVLLGTACVESVSRSYPWQWRQPGQQRSVP